jgi:hypothetical protein
MKPTYKELVLRDYDRTLVELLDFNDTLTKDQYKFAMMKFDFLDKLYTQLNNFDALESAITNWSV